MSKHQHGKGYRIVIVPEDGRESRTISMGQGQFALIRISIILFFVLWAVLGFFAFDYWHATQQNRLLTSEVEKLKDYAKRVDKVESNLEEMELYLKYIRLAMSLTGEEQPPSLKDFAANDSLKKSYELTADAGDVDHIPNILPVIGGYVTKKFDPSKGHWGVDYSSSEREVIRATARGLVIDIRVDENLGNIVEIDHGNGYITKFAHCHEIIAQKGAKVERGETIATVGNSGKSSSGPHLHYEIRKDGTPVDPQQLIIY